MENLETVNLKSDRLILQPVELKYKEEIFQEFTSEITTYMYPQAAKNISETEQVIKEMIQQRDDRTDLVLVISNKKTLEFLGMCGVHKIDTDTPELGVWVKKSAQGRGFGKEAIHLLKNWADGNLNYKYLSYPVDRRNIRSRKIALSLGGKLFDSYQKNNLRDDFLDLVEYRIFSHYSVAKK